MNGTGHIQVSFGHHHTVIDHCFINITSISYPSHALGMCAKDNQDQLNFTVALDGEKSPKKQV